MAKRLCVYVPGLTGTVESWKPLVGQLSKETKLSGTHWVPFEHGCTAFGHRRAIDAATELRNTIDAKVISDGPFEEIILIGHSMSGLLVRQAYLLAADIYPDMELGAGWHEQVTRIVLMASINRGIDPKRTSRTRTARRIERLIFWRHVFLRDLLRGSSFVTELRLQWIRYFHNSEACPQVVQLLGSNDEEVIHDDSIDVVQFPGAGHIYVPGADHIKLHRLDTTHNAAQHYTLIYQGIVGEFEDEAVPAPPKRVLVFLMHGIRAWSTGWVSQLKKEVETEARLKGRSVEVITPQKYNSALMFAVPWLHARLVRWFQDEYSQQFASNPKGDFLLACHSNGTYLAGRSLEKIRAMRFSRIYLAGSVLPTNYDWQDRFKKAQVEWVRNDCTTNDIPVGVLCRALSWLGRNVGTAGVHGFNHADDRLKNYRYFKGGHDTVLKDVKNRKTIVEFLLNGTFVDDPDALRAAIPQHIGWLHKILAVAIIVVLLFGLIMVVVTFPTGLWWALGFIILVLIALALF